MDANFATWRLDANSTTRGGRTATLSDNGESIKVDCKKCFKFPYNAGSFDKNELLRFNLDVAGNDDLQEWLEKVDQFVIDELSKDSQTYFKKQHTREKIQTMFKSSCTPHEKNGFVFNPTVRCKINVSGPKCITCYDSEKKQNKYTLRLAGI